MHKYSGFRKNRAPLGGPPLDETFSQGGARGSWKSTDQSISDTCRDMQEYPQKHKENLQKITKSTVGALRLPPKAGVGVLFIFFLIFPLFLWIFLHISARI